jgi:catechol 2,3-dioxygenase-like lactoylglutathione lyase family enzyme
MFDQGTRSRALWFVRARKKVEIAGRERPYCRSVAQEYLARMDEEGPVRGIDHVQVAAPAGCEPAARRFFGELLGLRELPKPPELAKRGGAWFQCGGQQLHVGVEKDFRPARKAHVALRLADASALEGLRERFLAAGVPVTEDSEPVPGVARFFAEDPWGNRMELVAPAQLARDDR